MGLGNINLNMWSKAFKKPFKIDEKMMNYVNDVIEETKQLWGNQVFLRIDVAVVCPDSKEFLDLIQMKVDTVDIPRYMENKSDIYLNERVQA